MYSCITGFIISPFIVKTLRVEANRKEGLRRKKTPTPSFMYQFFIVLIIAAIFLAVKLLPFKISVDRLRVLLYSKKSCFSKKGEDERI